MVNRKADFNRALGKRIRDAREKAGVQQDQLARAVGLSRTSITNIEQGRQGIQAYLLVRIAEVIGRRATDLLPEEEHQPPEPLPNKLRELEPSKREWAKRILSPEKDDDHET